MLLDARKWSVLDFSFFGVPQRRRRAVFCHGFERPPPDADAMPLSACGFADVVGSACKKHNKTWRGLSEPAHTVFSRGRPYLVLADGTRRVVTLDEATRLQGFPRSIALPCLSLKAMRHMVDDAVPPPVAQRIVRAAWPRVVRVNDLVVDLFCGGGGFGVGARLAGVRNLYAVDRDPDRLRVYTAAVRAVGPPVCNVTTRCCDLDDPDAWDALRDELQRGMSIYPDARVHIHASPPCGAVSAANHRRKEQQPQGLAFLKLASRFIEAFPRATVSAENGPMLLTTYPEFGGDR